MQRGIHGFLQSIRDHDLRHGNFFPREASLVQNPSRLHGEQPADFNFHRRLAHQALHAFAINQLHAEGIALRDAFHGNFQSTPRQSQPAHAVREPRHAQAHLRQLQSIAFIHQQMLIRDFQPIEFQFAMPAMFFRSHDRNAAHNLPARLIGAEQKGGKPLAGIIRRARDDDENLRITRASNEPFAPGDAPTIIADAFRLGIGQVRVGTAAIRFGHGEGGLHIAIHNRLQPARLHRFRQNAIQDHHIAVIRRGAIEHHGPEDGAIHFLITGGHANARQFLPAQALWHLQSPKPFRLRGLAHFCQHMGRDVFMLIEIRAVRFQRDQLFIHKAANAPAHIINFGG